MQASSSPVLISLRLTHQVDGGVVDGDAGETRPPPAAQRHGPLVEQDPFRASPGRGRRRTRAARPRRRRSRDRDRDARDRPDGRPDTLGCVREQVRHRVAADGDRDVARTCAAPLVRGDHARARGPSHVGRPQQHAPRRRLPATARRRALPCARRASAPDPGVGDHRGAMLVSTSSRRGPHSKKVGTFS